MSLIFFVQTEHGDFSRLLQEAFSSLLHTCKQHGHQNKSALLQKKQRIKNFKDSKLLLTAASPAAFFSEAQSVGTFSLEVKRWKKEVPRACGEFLPPRLAATQAILPPQSSSR